MTNSSNTNLNAPISDKGHLLTSLPDPRDLDGLRQSIVVIGDRAKQARDRGDDLIESHDEIGARAAYEEALDLEKWSINIAQRYGDFRLMFDADGGPLPSGRNSNYLLEGGEQRLASIYCDRLGRIGGLLRRLGKLTAIKIGDGRYAAFPHLTRPASRSRPKPARLRMQGPLSGRVLDAGRSTRGRPGLNEPAGKR